MDGGSPWALSRPEPTPKGFKVRNRSLYFVSRVSKRALRTMKLVSNERSEILDREQYAPEPTLLDTPYSGESF